MNPRRFALVGGIAMVALSVLSFFPGLNQLPAAAGLPPLVIESSYGYFLSFFPMNIVNKVVLLGMGIWGIAASQASTTALPRSIQWSRVVAGVMGVLTVLGLIPATNTLFGYYPLFEGVILVNAVFAVLGAYFGFALTAKAKKEVEPLLRDRKDSRVA